MITPGVSIFPNPVGRQNPVFHSGWSATDPGGFVWIEDAAAELLLDLPPVLGDLAFEVDCFPIEPSTTMPQRLMLFANGLFAGASLVRTWETVRFPLPREVAAARRLLLSLVPAMTEIPKRTGRGSDERVLPIGVVSVCLRHAT